MKKISIFYIFIFLIISSKSFAEWIKWGANANGHEFYYQHVKKHNNNIFFTKMIDYLKPQSVGELCSKMYQEVNCSNYSFKFHTFSSYKNSMCSGIDLHDKQEVKNYLDNMDWVHPANNSVDNLLNRELCKKY